MVNGREAFISDDWLSMANKIMELAESKEHREQLSTAAREFASDMDWISITKRYLDIFAAISRVSK